MVRPNQIVQREGKELTFLLFAQTESQAARRAVVVNFPNAAISAVFGGGKINDPVENTELFTEGIVNRYLVTVNTDKL